MEKYFYIIIYLMLALTGCEKEQESACTSDGYKIKISIPGYLESTKAVKSAISSLEIFCFNDDAYRKIDSYAVYGELSEDEVQFASRTGEKIIVAVANSHSRLNEEVYCYEDLAGVMANLCEEDPKFPLMIAQTSIRAGNGFCFNMKLKPLCARIRIAAIKMGIEGGAMLRNAQCYLTNVNTACKMLGQKSFVPSSILNRGMLNEHDLEQMKHKEMLVHKFRLPIGSAGVYENICLYCYPNDVEQESAGSQFTRLVIEGYINGKKYFYPININRNGFRSNSGEAEGIFPGCEYVYRLTLAHYGTSDPDIPFEIGSNNQDKG